MGTQILKFFNGRDNSLLQKEGIPTECDKMYVQNSKTNYFILPTIFVAKFLQYAQNGYLKESKFFIQLFIQRNATSI